MREHAYCLEMLSLSVLATSV